MSELIETRSKGQVRTFYNAEVKRINAVLAPLGVQIDPSDAEEVRTAMLHWRSMKDRLAPGFGTFQELCKRDKERNMFAWEFKNELDKSVWAEGKKEAKLKALGLIPAVSGDARSSASLGGSTSSSADPADIFADDGRSARSTLVSCAFGRSRSGRSGALSSTRANPSAAPRRMAAGRSRHMPRALHR